MYPVADAGAATLGAGAAVLTSCRRHCCWRCCQLNPRPKRGHSPVENLTDYLNSCTYHLLTEGNCCLQQQLKKCALREPNVLQRKRGAAIAAGAGAMPAAATAVCECDAARSLLPQQQSASATPQRLCCRNSSVQK